MNRYKVMDDDYNELFVYAFIGVPLVGDIIKEVDDEYKGLYVVTSRVWIDGKMCITVRNPGVVKA